MTELLERYTEHLRWLAEYSLLPAHLLAVGHWYTPAVCVGCLALLAHVAVAASHLRSDTVRA
ncbi:hypothetical protein SAMN02745119_01512 [Trichlorobacter thiogenes]|uniref:Uncharacterized protein n=1 Tax=Trichlorobacter thiogenes TaxID=115783 RepID=A0A1T4N586_9BACT|nr:hypothetical protein [Trichlorobacter thiogenes]SJZ74048.1 hypothetical protein SAMN02745119_01512 [Trichlorobacter thiogenes]